MARALNVHKSKSMPLEKDTFYCLDMSVSVGVPTVTCEVCGKRLLLPFQKGNSSSSPKTLVRKY